MHYSCSKYKYFHLPPQAVVSAQNKTFVHYSTIQHHPQEQFSILKSRGTGGVAFLQKQFSPKPLTNDFGRCKIGAQEKELLF